MRHPLSPADPCPMLQYADDTLIVMEATVRDIDRLRVLLDSFALATDLKINYQKSTVVPLNVVSDTLQHCIASLQCQVEDFPQKYLRLPMSTEKIRLATLMPAINHVDRYHGPGGARRCRAGKPAYLCH